MMDGLPLGPASRSGSGGFVVDPAFISNEYQSFFINKKTDKKFALGDLSQLNSKVGRNTIG